MPHLTILKSTIFLTSSILMALPVVAHNVEISNEIAATFHINPNHNPKAGIVSKAWFALTRRGGQSIALSECNCKLSIYAVPRKENAKPVLQPKLMVVDIDKYQEVPGARVTFPQGGAYELELIGMAKDKTSFSPFELTYRVNVRP